MSGSGDVHVSSVITGQGHFENVLQHLTFAVHQLCPHTVHRLQQQLPPCMGHMMKYLKVTVRNMFVKNLYNNQSLYTF